MSNRRYFLTKSIPGLAALFVAGCGTDSPRSKRTNVEEQPFKIDSELLKRYKTLKSGDPPPIFVMCPPRDIPVDSREKRDFQQGWDALVQTIEGLGGKVVRMDPDWGDSPAEMFTRDPALVFPQQKLFVVTKNFPENRGIGIRDLATESSVMSRILEENGFKKIEVDHFLVEGGDFLVDDERKLVFLGCDDPEADFVSHTADTIRQATGYDVMILPRGNDKNALTTKDNLNPRFYHLDVGMIKLPRGQYLVSESMMDATTLEKLRDRLGDDLILIKDRTEHKLRERSERSIDTEYMAYNLVAVGDTLIMPYCSKLLSQELKAHGYEIVTPEVVGFNFPMSQQPWIFHDGAVHCITQQIGMIKNQDHRQIQPAWKIRLRQQSLPNPLGSGSRLC